MKRNTRRSISVALSVVWLCNSMPVVAAGVGNPNSVAPNSTALVSDRLIVKYKANNLPKGLSVAQINAQLRQPLTAQAVAQLQTAAGVAMTEMHAISNGAHVMTVAGQPNRQALDNAIASISSLPNIEYVEEDKILSAQAVPNDPYYTTGPTGYPGLWDMGPVTVAAVAPAPGGTGSYGADFETAWNDVTGTGVVVAVVDTGITPNLDIVGPGGTVAATGNLVSTGYNFITDCRIRGTTSAGGCAATTSAASAVVAASADATDTGDYIDSTDTTTVGSMFYGWPTSSSSWHGTHVAGTIAALGNNNLGVIGGAYNAKILPVRVLGKGGGYLSDVAEGIKWAAGVHATIANPNPAKVINMSLGGGGTCAAGSTMQNAINAAVGAGTVVVVAAGNSNADVANFQPASCANVISVASIARDGSRAYYSNFSSPATNTTNPTNVTLAAQGGAQNYLATFDPGILSTLNSVATTPPLSGSSSYVYYQGTSMATPHAAAAAALMMAKNPTLTPAQVKTILSAPSSLTAFPSFSASGLAPYDCATKNNCGAGILNANRAVLNSTPSVTGPATADFGSVLVNSGSVSQTVTLTNTWFFSAQAGTATLAGPNASLFTIGADTCSGTAIASNGTCQITVSYASSAAAAHTATLELPVGNAASPTLVSLTAVTGEQLTTTTPTVTAATVNVGQSTTVNLSFTNPNVTPWRAGAVSLSQPAIMAASADNCSNMTLAAGANCTVTVTVTPATTGAYSGTASLGLSIGGAPAVASISGTASAAPASAGGGGGGGCSVMPVGATPDASLLLAMLAVAGYWLRRRTVRGRSAD